jgi:hypothetical protein
MNENDSWQRLVKLARQAPAEPWAGAPLGFAGRVVARWRAGEAPAAGAWNMWEGLSWRSLGVALAVMLLCLGVNFQSVREQFKGEPATPADLVALMLEE